MGIEKVLATFITIIGYQQTNAITILPRTHMLRPVGLDRNSCIVSIAQRGTVDVLLGRTEQIRPGSLLSRYLFGPVGPR